MTRALVLIVVFSLSAVNGSVRSLAQETAPIPKRSEIKIAQNTDFGSQVSYERGREFVRARVEEDGYYFTPELNISGHKDRPIQVSIWSNQNVFLGETRIVPPYDNTRWSALKVFVPFSRLKQIGSPFGYSGYAVALDEPEKYIAKFDVSSSNTVLPDLLWEWHEYRNDVQMGESQERGFLATVSLLVSGHQDQTLNVISMVRSQYYGDLPGTFGNPLRIASFSLTPQYPVTSYSRFELKCPYSLLTGFAPAEVVTLTPAVEINGVTYEANVHFRFLAGGSLERVEQLTRDEIEKDKQVIQNLRDRLNYLQNSRN